jgi:hypothetical protein
LASGILRPGAGKERPVEHGQLRWPVWIRNGHGEETGVFVIHIVELDAPIRTKGCQSQTLPVEEVLRYGYSDAWAEKAA